MKQEMLKLAKVAEEFEKAGNADAGKLITEAMKKIAEWPLLGSPGAIPPAPQPAPARPVGDVGMTNAITGQKPAPMPTGPQLEQVLQAMLRDPKGVELLKKAATWYSGATWEGTNMGGAQLQTAKGPV